MSNKSLEMFTSVLNKVWGEPSSELTLKSKQLLEVLAQTCFDDEWYRDLRDNQYPAKEIYRSEANGFILMGHVENKGELSPPHDHGNGWVLYSTVQGQVNMGIYHKHIKRDGSLQIIQKDAYSLKPGECSVYLQGDIHDTHTVEDNTVMLRLTSCDFSEEFEQGRLIRFQHQVEKWSPLDERVY